ncbi:HAMP domain-containing sensor histidine kinase [Magnetospira sp. QH-2]|uniref:sensor histidine kinase n=1 Tax=Magnetospira sp. (strain QH-2) TaxID=1288970 RepID=UPI0003E8124F|nr:HAMP domain-containing sensor histidine kinase [Magnetospira sp. QH-2]CCQ72116.1 Signal transduction histidine kinase [Magnetospira sp. QH-2]
MSDSNVSTPSFATGLSARLLLLIVALILLSEALIYVPSISRYRRAWLQEHLAAGHLASLALEATPDQMVDEELRDRLLFHAGAHGVAIQREGARFLALSADMPPAVDETVSLDREDWFYWIQGAFETLDREGSHVLRVMGKSPKAMEARVEVVLDEAPLRSEMRGYSRRILLLSLVISAVTAVFVYLGLHWMMVRPMRRITASMVAFRGDPEGDGHRLPDTDRQDEIGVAQRALAQMEEDVRSALRQKARLAALGGAVTKINHDLRNSLATAMLVSDRLAASADPDVREITPKLIRSIDRAVALCSHTLDYAGERDVPLFKERFYLTDLVQDVIAGLVIDRDGDGEVLAHVPPMLELVADEGQLHRALTNIGRNALQAGAKHVTIEAHDRNGIVVIAITDDGPGLPPKAQDKLFQPFAGSARKDGTGLGLVIARDVARAHNGDLVLDRTGAEGTVFTLSLPPGEEDEIT